MKTAVSVPDDVFRRADSLARRTGRSRSEIYSAALNEYLARHVPEEVTASLDRVVAGLGEAAAPDEFVRASASETLKKAEW
jgi:predicted transcriptional regulator